MYDFKGTNKTNLKKAEYPFRKITNIIGSTRIYNLNFKGVNNYEIRFI